MTEEQSTRFQRVMFATLLPALVLPITATTLAFWVQPSPPGPTETAYEWVSYIVLGVFLVVLLCSMNLNAWLLLRRPANRSTRSVPTATACLLALLYTTVVFWIVSLFVVPLETGVVTVLGPVTAAESIAVFVSIVVRNPAPRGGFDEIAAPSPRCRRAIVAYLAVATAGVAYAIVLASQSNSIETVPYWVPVLVALGIPWSPTAIAIVVLCLFVISIVSFGGIGLDLMMLVATALFVAPVVINIALSAGILASKRTRKIALQLLFWGGAGRSPGD